MPGADRTAVVRMRAEFDQAIRQWDKLTGAAQRSATAQAEAARRARTVGDDVDRTSKQLDRGGAAWLKYGTVAAGAIAGIQVKNLIRDAVALEAQFSKTMAQVAVATQAPAGEVKRLDDLALKLGADTVFSANDAASAMLSLAKGGLSVAQIEAGALADTLTLAAAGEMELGQAADVVVAAMGSFQLGAKDTDAAVAALAGGANASSASLQDMSMALSQTGTSANAAHFSIAETTAYLAAFADQGFKGSDAGTSLRTMLSRLVPQTKEAQQAADALGLSYVDSNGRLVSATEIAARTQKAFKGLSDEERSRAVNTIFGADAQRAVNALVVEGESGIRKYLKSTTDLTQAQQLADAANSGTAGSLEELSGAAETALIKLGRGLAPTVQDVAGDLADLLESGDVEAWGTAAAEAISDFMDELGPLADDLVDIAGGALPAVGTALETTAAGFQIVLSVVEPVVDLFAQLPDSAQQALLLAGAATVIGNRMSTAGARTMEYVRNIDRAEARSTALRVGIGGLGIGLSTLGSEMGDAGGEVGNLLEVMGGAATGFAVGGPWGAAVGGAISLVKAFGDSNRNVVPDIEALSESLDKQTGKLTENSREMVVNALQKNDAFKRGRDLGIDAGTITDAALGQEKALERIRKAREAAREEYRQAVADGTAGFEDIPDDQDFDKLLDILGDQNDALKDARRGWDDEASAKSKSFELNKLGDDQISAATKAIKEQGIAIRDVPREVVTQFTQPGYDQAEEHAVEIARKYKLTPKEVRTVLTALDYSTEQIDRVLAGMRKVDGKTATVRVYANVDQATGQILGFRREVERLDGTTATVYSRVVRSGQVGGGTTQADGSVLSFYADGGTTRENHVAQIAPAGSWRVWAEPETMGEAYIPLAPAKRPRSMEIWRQTGRLLGATEMDFYADGKIRGHSLDYWEEKRASRLELARMQQRITELQRSLRETEKYGRGNKRSRRRLRGIDRTVAELELRDARKELEEARFANALNRSRSGTIQQRINQRDGAGQRAEDAESTRAANDVLARAKRAGLNPEETAAALTAQQGVLDAQRRLREAKKGTLEYKVAETEVAKAKTELNDVLTRADAKKTELEQANEEAEQAQQQRQQASESFARNGAISRWSSAGAASRSTDRSIADMGTFIDLLVQLRGKGAPGWLLQQLQDQGPSREAIRVARQYLGSPELLARANVQAAQIQALSGAYGALTSSTAWWPGTTVSAAQLQAGGVRQLQVAIDTLNPNAITAEVQRVVRHELGVMIGVSG